MPETTDLARVLGKSNQAKLTTMPDNTTTKVDRPMNRATDTDRHVGVRIRERRIMLGLSQQQMADLIGVTYQQAHKYERGINRISAGRPF